MGALNVFPRLAEQNGVFLCSDLKQRESTRRYRVPVEHRRFELFGEAFDSSLRAVSSGGGGKTVQQLAEAMADSGGIGLFAAQGWPLGGPDGTREPTQEEHGAVLIIPPQFWEEEHRDLKGWIPEGLDPFEDLPYKFDDMAVFAKINFTPDVWYFVKRGPLEGKIFRWQHDDESDSARPWADDLVAWATRVWDEVPELFGGITRWNRVASPDEDCPDNAELYPEEFVLE
jgi:hypothetical protein